MTDAVVLGVGPDGALPTLLHPGRAVAWWWSDAGPAWHDGERLWVLRGARVRVVALRAPIEVEPLDDGGVVAWTEAGDVVYVGPDLTLTWRYAAQDAPTRNGADIRAVRLEGGWRVQAAGTDVPLPEGATRARDLRPFRRGEGAVWRSGGWVYRMAHRAWPRALGEITAKASFVTGPHGAVLVGGEAAWERAAPARGHLRPLPVPLLRTPWGVRWSRDGTCVAGVDPDGAATWIDLAAGQVRAARPGALPLDGGARWLGEDGTLGVGGEVTWRPREATCALRGDSLAGPGGVVWDLASGRPRFARPVVRLGVTVATGADWLSVDWERGHGVRFDPLTGQVGARFEVPLARDDVLARGWPDGPRVVLESAEGQRWAVEGAQVTPLRADAPSPSAPASRSPRAPAWAPPLDGAVQRGGRVYGWSDDGLLLAWPAS